MPIENNSRTGIGNRSPQSQAYEVIFEELISEMKKQLPMEIINQIREFEHSKPNRTRIYLKGIKGSHYEICFRKGYYEFALHFESSDERNLARKQEFDPHLDEIGKAVGVYVQSGKLENEGWKRVWFEQQREKIDHQKILLYSNLFACFIIATFPILIKTYSNGK